MDDQREREQRGVAVPPGPICERCGHDLCPCCPVPWCDRVERTGDEVELCCDGGCLVAPGCFARWRAEVDAVIREHGGRNWVQVADGPWLPEAVRLERYQ